VSPSKIELQEIVDYLNDPKSFSKYGAKLPRGVLLVGPSGTGKTLMARAVAGEAHCAFLSVSASEFVETYVGRGSARIRNLFKQAREMSPAVLFIDELDALGKRQSTFGGGNAHDEYVQTMNQLLVELDGISGHEDGLVVIGATNRFNALDSALLRPGRFDRHVWLQLPADKERQDILRLNCELRGLVLKDPMIDLAAIAREAISFSGADLANLVNEAVFFSRRRGGETVTMMDLRSALAKCRQVVYNRNRNVSSPRRAPEDISTALE
jgi:cell division protease FtsH